MQKVTKVIAPFLLIPFILLVTACTSASKAVSGGSSELAPIFRRISGHGINIRQPIGESYAVGERELQGSNGTGEARIVHEREGSVFISLVDQTVFLGLAPEKQRILFERIPRNLKYLKFPGIVDVQPRGAGNYYDFASRFIADFNIEMFRLAKF